MEWIKFSKRYPEKATEILFCDENVTVAAFFNKNGMLFSQSYYCNNPGCEWTYDDCNCPLVISPNSFWMPIPDQPERLSEKTSKEDAIV
jgi:hypothetical protein